MEHLLPALALVLVIEGLVLALLPRRLGEVLKFLESQNIDSLRSLGLGAASLGAILYWIFE